MRVGKGARHEGGAAPPVGRTPRSAAGPLAGPAVAGGALIGLSPAGPGGPARTRGSAPPWRRSRQRGATLVEFALVAFIFLLVVFAGFEFSRLVLVYTTVTNAARIGARYAIVSGSKSGAPADVVAEVKNFAGAGTIDVSKLIVTVTNLGGPPGSIVQVDVKYPYDPFTIVPLSVTLHASTQGVITY